MSEERDCPALAPRNDEGEDPAQATVKNEIPRTWSLECLKLLLFPFTGCPNCPSSSCTVLLTGHRSLLDSALEQNQARPRHLLRHGEVEFRESRLLQRADDVDAHGLHGRPRPEGLAAVALGLHDDALLA